MLEVEYDYDFLAIGISSREPDYRICWLLNQAMGIELRRDEFNHIIYNNNIENHHIIYSFFSEEEQVGYSLIKNKSSIETIEDLSTLTLFNTKKTSSYLVPELSKFEYFLKITDSMESNDLLLDKTKKTPFINAVYEIPVKKLKSKDNLIFE